MNLLKLSDIYKNSILKFYFKHEHNTVPDYFHGRNFIDIATHNHSTRRRDSLRIPRVHSSCAQQNLRYLLPKYILSTPRNILEKIHTHSYNGFCWYVKKMTLLGYESECSIQNCYICNRR